MKSIKNIFLFAAVLFSSLWLKAQKILTKDLLASIPLEMIDIIRAQILSEKTVLKFPERLPVFSPFLLRGVYLYGIDCYRFCRHCFQFHAEARCDTRFYANLNRL